MNKLQSLIIPNIPTDFLPPSFILDSEDQLFLRRGLSTQPS